MSSRKFFLLLGLLLLLSLALIVAGCGNNTTKPSGDSNSSQASGEKQETAKQEPAKQIVLKLGHIGSPQEVKQEVALKLAELVGQRTNGQIKIDVYPAGQLAAKAGDAYKALSAGAMDLTVEAVSFLEPYNKNFTMFSTWYQFLPELSIEGTIQVTQTSVAQEIINDIREKQCIRVLAQNYVRGERFVYSKKPVKNMDDLKGLKIRVPEQKQFMETVKSFDMVPVGVPWTETYMALSQGMVDAVEANYNNFEAQKFYETTKYATSVMTLPKNALGISISEKTYQSLSPDQQKIITEAAVEAGAFGTKRELEEDQKVVDRLKGFGVNFVDIPESEWRPKLEGLPQRLEDAGVWDKGLYNRIAEAWKKEFGK